MRTTRSLFKLALPIALAVSCSTESYVAPTSAMYGYPLDADYAVATTTYDTGLYGYDPFYPTPLPTPFPPEHDDDAEDPVSAIRAAADGVMDACPGAAQIELKYGPAPCSPTEGDEQTIQPIGATLWFNQCTLNNGAVLDGTIDSVSAHTASDGLCDDKTTIIVTFAATFNNLSYRAPSGKKTVVTGLNVNGRFDHPIGQPPQIISAKLDANIRRFDAADTLTSDRTFSGTVTSSLNEAPATLTTEGTFDASNTIDDSEVRIQIDAVQHQAECCHATAGQVSVTGADASETMEFGPECGEAKHNGQAISLDECP